LFGEPGRILTGHWVPAVLLAFGTAVVFVSSALLVGLKRPFAGFFAEAIFRPLAVIAAFVFGLALVADHEAGFSVMMWVLAIAYLVIAAVQFGFVVRATREVPVVV